MPRKEPGFAERLQTATKAKQAQLEKIRTTTRASDPQAAERQAARVEAAEARKTRAAEKARQAQAVAEQQARKDAERAARAEADAALQQVQKAARDSKYCANRMSIQVKSFGSTPRTMARIFRPIPKVR